jgi:prepilin peptidase CpaA
MDPALTFACMLTLLLLIAMGTDVARYIIPNWLNALVLLLYPAMLWTVPGGADVPWLHGIYGMLSVFAVGYALFAFNIMGGGDVKLLAALSLWMGFGIGLAKFLIFASVLGGFLTLILLGARVFAVGVGGHMKRPPTLPRLLSHGEPVPYGIAISLGFLMVLWNGEVAGLEPVGKIVKLLLQS